MSKEKRFDVGPGLEGCLVTGVCVFVMTLFVVFILYPLLERSELLVEIYHKTVPVQAVVGWLFAICLGGYHAARRGKATGWTNSLVVGLLAECYLFARLDLGFLKLVDETNPNWQQLAFLWLTIPAAILGGMVWEKTSKSDEAGGDDQSEAASSAEDSEE